MGSVGVDGGNEAYRWTEQTGMISLGDFEGGPLASSATGVSADGSVVVGRAFDTHERGFRWTEQTGMVALEAMPSQLFQRPWAVSWDGNVVVGEAYAESRGEAFYWTAEDGTRWLLDVLADHGVVVPDGWNLDSALGVSADGRTIVGYGVNPDNFTEGWVAYLGPVCRADYDKSGSVTESDFHSYLAAWMRRSIFADWDYDGYVNTIDLIGFLNEWAAGC